MRLPRPIDNPQWIPYPPRSASSSVHNAREQRCLRCSDSKARRPTYDDRTATGDDGGVAWRDGSMMTSVPGPCPKHLVRGAEGRARASAGPARRIGSGTSSVEDLPPRPRGGCVNRGRMEL
jgi:hypothetical protein